MTRQEQLHDDGFDMIILGGGLAALAAGYAAVKRGQRPLILEERGRPGGLVCGATFAGAQVDIGAESYATRNPAVRELCHELGLETVAPNSSSWVWDHARRTAVAIPAGTFGIPSDIHDPVFVEGLRAVAGEAAVTRAWQDLELPPEIGAEATTLGELVEARMGRAVLDVFVTPFAGGIHSAHPDHLMLDRVTPGLMEAFGEVGTLTGAVAQIRKPGAVVVEQSKGGMFQLVEALSAAIQAGGGRIDNHVRVMHLEAGIGQDLPRWVVWCKHTVSNRRHPGGPPEESGTAFGLATDRVVLALPAKQSFAVLTSAAASMLRLGFHAQKEGRDASTRFDSAALESIGELTAGFEMHPATPVLNVTLVVQNADLDRAPRGSGMLVGPPPLDPETGEVAPETLRAKALTHYSIKWPDTMGGAAQPHTHVLRVSYGREGDPLDFLAAVDVDYALRDASRMLGVELDRSQLLDSRLINWGDAMTHPNAAEREKFREVVQLAQRVEGLDLVGSWVAGNGITPVIAHALQLG